LYNNVLQGIDWTNFRYLKSYLEKNRESHGYPPGQLNLEIDAESVKEDNTYSYIRKQYSNFYSLCFYSIGFKDPKYVWNKLILDRDIKPHIKTKLTATVTLSIFVSQWYRYIDSRKLGMKIVELVETYLRLKDIDPLYFWARSLKKKDTSKILGSAG
jgi:hypothetical protein